MAKRASRQTFVYNEEHFQYVPVRRSLRWYVLSGLPYLGVAVVLALGLVWLFYTVYDSPETARLHQQNEELTEQIELSEQAVNDIALQLDSLKARERDLYRTALDAEPLEDTAAEEQTTRIATVADLNTDRLNDLESRLAILNSRINQNLYTSAVILEQAALRSTELRNMPSIRPVASEIISGFGTRKHPVYKDDRLHPGIDFRADEGTEVRATGGGTVRKAGEGGLGLGIVVEIDHGNGYVTRYSHLQQPTVNVGQRVRRGDVIARSGSSGMSKGPHLFYQILRNEGPIDPIDFFYNDLSPDEYRQFREQASQYNESMN
jgi:murein DD-endopeptidase MepM/ murein hydrolase activator NlpD